MAGQETTPPAPSGYEEYGPRTLSPQEQAKARSNARKQSLLRDALTTSDPARMKAAADALTDQVLQEMYGDKLLTKR